MRVDDPSIKPLTDVMVKAANKAIEEHVRPEEWRDTVSRLAVSAALFVLAENRPHVISSSFIDEMAYQIREEVTS
jgi:hypothetical protein